MHFCVLKELPVFKQQSINTKADTRLPSLLVPATTSGHNYALIDFASLTILGNETFQGLISQVYEAASQRCLHITCRPKIWVCFKLEFSGYLKVNTEEALSLLVTIKYPENSKLKQQKGKKVLIINQPKIKTLKLKREASMRWRTKSRQTQQAF